MLARRVAAGCGYAATGPLPGALTPDPGVAVKRSWRPRKPRPSEARGKAARAGGRVPRQATDAHAIGLSWVAFPPAQPDAFLQRDAARPLLSGPPYARACS